MPANTRTIWDGATYNAQGAFTRTQVQETLFPSSSGATPGQQYVTDVKLAYLVSSHAELNHLVGIDFDIADSGAVYLKGPASVFTGTEFLNDRSVPYPVIPVLPTWGPYNTFFFVPPPVTPPYVQTSKGCGDNIGGASRVLGVDLAGHGFPRPATGFDAHHIKPLCFGGSNIYTNGIWLPKNAVGEPDFHTPFTTWFDPRNFTP